MRSIKSQLYLFVKSIIFGTVKFPFTDNLGKVYTFAGIPEIVNYLVWNAEFLQPETKDGYAWPAVFFEYASIPTFQNNMRGSVTDQVATSKDQVLFSLHVVTGKVSAEIREDDYLDLMDLVSLIRSNIQGLSFSNCKNIIKIDEIADHNSGVLYDHQILFTATITDAGEFTKDDANDTAVNPAAPVEFTIDAGFL